MTTATRNSAFVLLATLLLLAGCASSSWPAGWSHAHDVSGRGYWAGPEGGLERFYPSEHPSSSPIPHTHDLGLRRWW